jgi:hypothetical protein
VVTHSLPLDNPNRPGTAGVTATRLEYRLDVLGTDAADLVRSAGGWMFDRAMAGWRVDAWLLDTGELRPLQVLGVQGHRRKPDVVTLDDEIAGGLAVSSSLVAADGRVRDELRSVLVAGRPDVSVDATESLVCGSYRPVDSDLIGTGR